MINKTGVKIVEFDVSQKRHIERGFKLKEPNFYPILWVNIKQKHVDKTFDYKFKQNIAAKFLDIKLLSSSNPNSYSNIDLYNLGLTGVPITFPGDKKPNL